MVLFLTKSTVCAILTHQLGVYCMYVINELKLREHEIEEIKYKIERNKEKIKENEIKEKMHSKIYDGIFNVAVTVAVIELLLLCFLHTNLINLDINVLIGIYCATASLVIGSSVLNALYIEKLKKTIKKLNVELNENNELLLTRTNYLNELKNKNNKKENEYTNYKYKIINNSNSLVESKTSGKTRIRKKR